MKSNNGKIVISKAIPALESSNEISIDQVIKLRESLISMGYDGGVLSDEEVIQILIDNEVEKAKQVAVRRIVNRLRRYSPYNRYRYLWHGLAFLPVLAVVAFVMFIFSSCSPQQRNLPSQFVPSFGNRK